MIQKKLLPKRQESSQIRTNVEEQVLIEPVRAAQSEHEQEMPSTAKRRGQKTFAILVISSVVIIFLLLLLAVLSYLHFTDFFHERQMVAQEVYNTTLGNETLEETFVVKHEKKSMDWEIVLPHVKEPVKEVNSEEVNRREQLSKELLSLIPKDVGDIIIRLSTTELLTLSFEIRLQDVDRIFTITEKNASISEWQIGEKSARVLKHKIDKETAWSMLNNIETCKSLSLEMIYHQFMSQSASTLKFLQTTFQRQDFLPLLTRVKRLKIQTNLLDFLKLLLENFSKIVESKATFQLEWLPSEAAQYKETMFTLLKKQQFRDCQIIEWDSKNDFSHEVLLGSNAMMTIRNSGSLEESLVLVDKLLELGPSVGKLGSLSMIRWVHREHTENIKNAMFTNFQAIHNRLKASTGVSRIVGNQEEMALVFELSRLRIKYANEFGSEEFDNVEFVRKTMSRNTELVVMLTIQQEHNHFRIQIIGNYRDI
ncbi:unnamed protein product, partial [Mesorhabditis belari]|uniref:Uncharacterized protein n=1 Tax=Mesorhabditis belari TaxID=2138241 RepID=A0AAF3EQQ5_9BILA